VNKILLILCAAFLTWFIPHQLSQARDELKMRSHVSPMHVTTIPTPSQPFVSWREKKYHYGVAIVQPQHEIRLHSNLESKKSMSQISTSCDILVNAGFHKQNNKHIGWFVGDNQILSQPEKNKLFIGYVWSRDGKEVFVSRKPPDHPVLWGVQTGPILYEYAPTHVQLSRDEQARRVIIATGPTNQPMFLVVYDKEVPYSGPLLSDLPQIVARIKKQESLDFSKAINLDGGTHSYFQSPTLTLRELQPVGGYFCVN
jgi:hypothetical protein